MKRYFFAFLFVTLCSSLASADVTLTFDSDLEGFTKEGDSVSVAWSAVNGGSMAITSNGGWSGNSAAYAIASNAPMFAELNNAINYGGTISYDIIIREEDQSYSLPPTWFETVAIFNSAGGWDQDIVAHGLGGGSWPLDGGLFTQTSTLDISGTAGVANDGIKYTDTSGFWTNLHLGLNNDGGRVTTAVVYFDNIVISANPIPEPGSLALIALTGLGLVARRRRKSAD